MSLSETYTEKDIQERLEIARQKLILTDILRLFQKERVEEASVQSLFPEDGAATTKAINTRTGLVNIISNIRENLPDLQSKIDEIIEKNRVTN